MTPCWVEWMLALGLGLWGVWGWARAVHWRVKFTTACEALARHNKPEPEQPA